MICSLLKTLLTLSRVAMDGFGIDKSIYSIVRYSARLHFTVHCCTHIHNLCPQKRLHCRCLVAVT
jgi:hypothetical protein